MTEHRSIGKQISTISRCLSMILDIKTAHLGLSAATIPILTFLYANDGVHQDILAEALQFNKSSAARAVARLAKEGYITKTADPSNRRRNIILTTQKAHDVRQEILRILKGLTEDLFTDFSEEEIDRYFDLTRKIHARTAHMLKEIK